MMFKKTRNRILLLNMAMISAVAALAFILVFFSALNRVKSENRDKLSFESVSEVRIAGKPFDFSLHTQGYSSIVIQSEVVGSVPYVSGFTRGISPYEGVSFSLLVDSAGTLVEYNSMVGLPYEAYVKAAEVVVGISESEATVSLEDRIWQYKTTPVTIEFLDTDNAMFLVSGEFSSVRFLDVTDSYAMLRSLGLTLSMLFAGLLAVFFFISLFFANRAIAPLSEAWDKQTRFIADASHELKTPLSVIHANCAALCVNGDMSVASQKKWIDNIISGADRMTSLIDNMLTLSYIEDEKTVSQKTVFDLSKEVSCAVSEAEASAVTRGIIMKTQIEPGIVIASDADRVNTVVRALLDNAVKYTPEGGTIQVTLTSAKKLAEIVVRNDSDGISEEDLPRLFDRFYRADPARSSQTRGYGMGLAIAKAASERLSAKLTAKSEPGKYIEFRFIMNLQ